MHQACVPGCSRAPRSSGRGGAGGRFAVLALVLVVLIASYASSLRAWLQQRAELEAARDRITSGEAQVEQLTEQAERWRDPAYVEQQARERLAWVMPGEVGYTVKIGRAGQQE